MRKGISQQQEHVNGVTANQGSDKVKYMVKDYIEVTTNPKIRKD
jgi:hypothetical protein